MKEQNKKEFNPLWIIPIFVFCILAALGIYYGILVHIPSGLLVDTGCNAVKAVNCFG